MRGGASFCQSKYGLCTTQCMACGAESLSLRTLGSANVYGKQASSQSTMPSKARA
ncbi:MAG: hypothetical protein R2749_15630 [Acidimicrobiales bacterium]